MSFDIGPNLLNGVELRCIRWQINDAEPRIRFQECLDNLRTMNAGIIKHHGDRAINVPQEVGQISDNVIGFDRAFVGLLKESSY